MAPEPRSHARLIGIYRGKTRWLSNLYPIPPENARARARARAHHPSHSCRNRQLKLPLPLINLRTEPRSLPRRSAAGPAYPGVQGVPRCTQGVPRVYRVYRVYPGGRVYPGCTRGGIYPGCTREVYTRVYTRDAASGPMAQPPCEVGHSGTPIACQLALAGGWQE